MFNRHNGSFDHRSLVLGSPNSIQVRRTSPSLTPDLARAVASPIVRGWFLPLIESKINLKISWFIAACPPGSVMPDEAHTATAQRCDFSRPSARLSIAGSWKNPFRLVIEKNSDRLCLLVSAPPSADVSRLPRH